MTKIGGIPLILSLLTMGCATPLERIGAGGSDFSRLAGAYTVTIYRAGERPIYATGSEFAPAPLVEIDQTDTSESLSIESPIAEISVRAPEAVASDLAAAIAQSMTYSGSLLDGLGEKFAINISIAPPGPVRHFSRFAPGGAPWPLDFTIPPNQVATPSDRARTAGMIAHEAFHLSNAIALRGRFSSRYQERPDAGWIYEETAALLLADCATLDIGFAVDLARTPAVTLDLVDERSGDMIVARPPFETEVLRKLRSALSAPHGRGAFPAAIIYIGFYQTLFERISDGAEMIEPGTAAADRMMQFCAEVVPDTSALERALLPRDDPPASP